MVDDDDDDEEEEVDEVSTRAQSHRKPRFGSIANNDLHRSPRLVCYRQYTISTRRETNHPQPTMTTWRRSTSTMSLAAAPAAR
jgi:hypothetical protein